MPLSGHLRWLMAPERSRWKPMLMGLALSAAGAGGAVLTQPSFVSLGLLIVAMVAWFVGAFCMVGFARWFFAAEMVRAAQDRATALDQERKRNP
jgi:hypothetical protein